MTREEAYDAAAPVFKMGAKEAWVSEDGKTFRHKTLADRYHRITGVQIIHVDSSNSSTVQEEEGPVPAEEPAHSSEPKKKGRPRKKKE